MVSSTTGNFTGGHGPAIATEGTLRLGKSAKVVAQIASASPLFCPPIYPATYCHHSLLFSNSDACTTNRAGVTSEGRGSGQGRAGAMALRRSGFGCKAGAGVGPYANLRSPFIRRTQTGRISRGPIILAASPPRRAQVSTPHFGVNRRGPRVTCLYYSGPFRANGDPKRSLLASTATASGPANWGRWASLRANGAFNRDGHP